MDRYVTGDVIRSLRESKGLTQEALAQRIFVSGKAVSKWETGHGYPDVSLLEPLAAALGISVIELLSGQPVKNRNRAANMARGKWYVCPVCANVVYATGAAIISCCGIPLPPQEPEMTLGKYALMRRSFLQKNRRVMYTNLLTSGKLNSHLQEVEQSAQTMLAQLTGQMAREQGVTEELKARDQLEWVQMMNSIRQSAEETILTELIYS